MGRTLSTRRAHVTRYKRGFGRSCRICHPSLHGKDKAPIHADMGDTGNRNMLEKKVLRWAAHTGQCRVGACLTAAARGGGGF